MPSSVKKTKKEKHNSDKHSHVDITYEQYIKNNRPSHVTGQPYTNTYWRNTFSPLDLYKIRLDRYQFQKDLTIKSKPSTPNSDV